MLSTARLHPILTRNLLAGSHRPGISCLVRRHHPKHSSGIHGRPRFFSGSNNGSTSNSGSSSRVVQEKSFLQRFLAPKEMPERGTFAWYREMVLICTVFAITGTSTMMLVRPAVKNVLGLQGSFKEGPWSYRICTIVIMSPLYSILLVMVGTVFGRHAYFRFFSVKMLSRFGIPTELMDKNFEATKKTFKKW
ncbi:expressed unknown protein [Seminavis robusta]|uniref:DUF6787 domain-containing protein n=1 Tax=Seminavis robusta TaxID=568900 RepID=A0A9N8EA80_9STRA|nr:expressed unknown protein [Seminavis robusta]|eukprot:Sro667_g184220.1 n/a (192) ;mRNA; r:39545-40120